MASTPKDLTNASWKKVKGLTVPETGFGKVLDAYQAARKKTIDLPTRNVASFGAAATALTAITKAVPAAVAKCNKTLHKDTIAALGAYANLVKEEGLTLSKEATKYQGYVDMYKHKREVCGKELSAIKKSLDELGVKALGEVKKLMGSSDKKAHELAEKLVEKTKAELTKLQHDADTSLAKPRVPGPAAETPHADDRPDASVFTALIDKQKEIIGDRTHIERALDEALKKK